LALLRRQILELSQRLGLDKDLGFDAADEAAALGSLDNHLCELKELQIRDGLHVFGRSPEGGLLTDLLVALVRVPRGEGKGGDASLLRALAADLGLGDFDPLAATLGEPWEGPRPAVLAGAGSWRSKGDTVERLEELSRALVAGACPCEAAWTRSAAVLEAIESRLRPAVESCGGAEIAGLLRGLDGRFLEPRPSR